MVRTQQLLVRTQLLLVRIHQLQVRTQQLLTLVQRKKRENKLSQATNEKMKYLLRPKFIYEIQTLDQI